jgi:hypothetical protein
MKGPFAGRAHAPKVSEEVSDRIEKARAELIAAYNASERSHKATPYRLGRFVGQNAIDAPCPYLHPSSVSCFRDGVRVGAAQRRAEAKLSTESAS